MLALQDLITVDDPLNASLAYVQQEYSDLTVKYQALGAILQQVRAEKASLEADAEEKERLHSAEVDSLRRQNQELVLRHRESLEATAMANAAAAAAASASAAIPPSPEPDDKFDKLKTAYQKLRNEHVALLRQKADIEKRVKTGPSEIYASVSNALKACSYDFPATCRKYLVDCRSTAFYLFLELNFWEWDWQSMRYN